MFQTETHALIFFLVMQYLFMNTNTKLMKIIWITLFFIFKNIVSTQTRFYKKMILMSTCFIFSTKMQTLKFWKLWSIMIYYQN